MACEKYQETLREAAAAATAVLPEVQEHLEFCADCRLHYDQAKKLFAAIDDGLSAIANVEPSSTFLPQVQARIREVQSGKNNPRGYWLGSRLLPVAASFGVLFFLIFVLHKKPIAGPDTPTAKATILSKGNEESRNPLQSEALEAGLLPKGNQIRNQRDYAKSLVTSSKTEVLVSPSEREAFASLAALSRRSGKLPRGLTGSPIQGEIKNLQIASLQIEPLKVELLAEPADTAIPSLSLH